MHRLTGRRRIPIQLDFGDLDLHGSWKLSQTSAFPIHPPCSTNLELEAETEGIPHQLFKTPFFCLGGQLILILSAKFDLSVCCFFFFFKSANRASMHLSVFFSSCPPACSVQFCLDFLVIASAKGTGELERWEIWGFLSFGLWGC